MVVDQVIVRLEQRPSESDEELAKLVRELELDLRDVVHVEYLPAASAPGAKSAGEVVAGALAVVGTLNPDYVQAVAHTIVAFLRRNENRRAHIKVGKAELRIDQPTTEEVARIIDLMQSALDSSAGGRRKR